MPNVVFAARSTSEFFSNRNFDAYKSRSLRAYLDVLVNRNLVSNSV